jgi:hypothetical protein
MHYCIAVITQQQKNVGSVLAQYDENLEVAEYGEEGTMYNPNGHWDWYQIGGRWAGMLKVKKTKLESSRDSRGEKSLLCSNDPYQVSSEDEQDGIAYVDSSLIQDIENLDEILTNSIYGYVSSIGWKDRWECCRTPAENPKYPGETNEDPKKVAIFYEDMNAFVESHFDYYLTIVDCHN